MLQKTQQGEAEWKKAVKIKIFSSENEKEVVLCTWTKVVIIKDVLNSLNSINSK